LAGGLGQVDTKRNVRVVEDRVACGATTNNSDDCSIVTDSAQNRPERPRFQDLTAFKQAGPGFVGLGFGVGFSPTSLMTLDVGVRASVTFPVVMPVFSPEAGVSFGF
jgi:hypothetical protein